MKDYAINSYVNELLNSLFREVVREKREAIENKIWTRYCQIQNLLDGGRDILELSSGENFTRLIAHRCLLRVKLFELLRVIDMINQEL